MFTVGAAANAGRAMIMRMTGPLFPVILIPWSVTCDLVLFTIGMAFPLSSV
jgi:hypothetical protein